MKQTLNTVLIGVTKELTKRVTKTLTKRLSKPRPKTITTIGLSLVVYSLSLTVVAQNTDKSKDLAELKEQKENKAAITTSAKQAPVVIETQVKGSQEQPTVIYILPWQGIDTPVIIEGEHSKIAMPNFKPINPKQFKKQATQLYDLHLNSEVEN